MRDLPTFDDELTCTKMPPHIGIGHAARSQDKKAKHKYGDKNPARFQDRIHCGIIPQPAHKIESAGLKIKVS